MNNLFKAYIVALISFLGATACQTTTHSLDENLSNTSQIIEMNESRYGMATAKVGNQLYVFGGTGFRGLLGTVEQIDLDTGNVVKLPISLIPRRYHSAIYDGKDTIYIVGGESLNKRSRMNMEQRVEMLNIRTMEVTFGPKLHAATTQNTGVAIDNEIFIVGGDYLAAKGRHQKALKSTKLVAVLDTISNQWLSGPSMHAAKATSAVNYNNDMYVVGGYDQNKAMAVFERLDSKANEWSPMPPPPKPVSAHATADIKNKLYTFGAYEFTDQVMEFDFATNEWRELSLDFTGVRHAVAISYNNHIYLVGGLISLAAGPVNKIQKFRYADLEIAAK